MTGENQHAHELVNINFDFILNFILNIDFDKEV